ncbi:MAG: hypothetical protein JZU47_15095 [Prolixibacteraceae bacterium]|nr:hypothetical protein [Prolixibacteraceae bacterium]
MIFLELQNSCNSDLWSLDQQNMVLNEGGSITVTNGIVSFSVCNRLINMRIPNPTIDIVMLVLY